MPTQLRLVPCRQMHGHQHNTLTRTARGSLVLHARCHSRSAGVHSTAFEIHTMSNIHMHISSVLSRRSRTYKRILISNLHASLRTLTLLQTNDIAFVNLLPAQHLLKHSSLLVRIRPRVWCLRGLMPPGNVPGRYAQQPVVPCCSRLRNSRRAASCRRPTRHTAKRTPR